MAKTPVFSLLLAATLSGCMASFPGSPQATSAAIPYGDENSLSRPGSANPGRAVAPSVGVPASASPPMAAPAGGVTDAAEGATPPKAMASAAPTPLVAEDAPLQEALRAGAVDDNAKFSEFLKYVTTYVGGNMRALDVSRRFVIEVVDSQGRTVSNANIAVSAGEAAIATAKTYANGQTLFHPGAFAGTGQAEAFTVTATHGAETVSQTFEADAEGVWRLTLPGAIAKPAAQLDVLFVLDATGSMGGEIDRLQSTIKTMASRIQALPHQPTVRFGLVAYRDQNEEYVTKKTDFTADVDAFKAALDLVQAEGGGDKPEDVEAALAAGVGGMSWRTDDTVRLSFLVADAAPHVDYPQSTPYTTSLKRATEKGVKIYPIGCSGLEKEGELAFRQMAQFTMGQYLFITRGGDEFSGGGQVSATVDKFEEGRLDDIVVDIVKAELDSLGK